MTAVVSLDFLPLWAVFFGTMLGIPLICEVGYRLGRFRIASGVHEKEGPVGGMVAAELGLLAFLLAFTFGIAAARFDERRQLMINESNAIGTAYLRAELVAEPQRGAIRKLLREYTALRLEGQDVAKVQSAIERSEALHERLWAETAAASARDVRSVPSGLLASAMNEVIDLHAKRVNSGLFSRLPTTIWAVLFALALLCFLAMGYQVGLADQKRSPVAITVALAFGLVIWLVADLERPHEGTLRVNQRPLLELQKSMNIPENK